MKSRTLERNHHDIVYKGHISLTGTQNMVFHIFAFLFRLIYDIHNSFDDYSKISVCPENPFSGNGIKNNHEQDRLDDLERMTKEPAYREQLFRELGL